MISNLLEVAADLRSLVGGGSRIEVVPHEYRLPVDAWDIPYGDRARLNDLGMTEVELPKDPWPAAAAIPFFSFGVLISLGLAHNAGLVGILFGIPWWIGLGASVYVAFVRTSYVIDNHWLLRRRCLRLVSYAFETEFPVDRLEIENGVWTTGRGSSDRLYLIGPRGRTKLYGVDAFNAGRAEALSAEPRIDGSVLRLARMISYKASVPVGVVVKPVAEPSND